MGSIIKSNFSKIFGIILWFLLWQLGAYFVDNLYILPSPLNTISSLLVLIKEPSFFYSVTTTLARVFTGFFISVLLGVSLGFMSGINIWVHDILKPFVIVVKSTPVISVILMIALWVESNYVPVVISFLMGFPIMWQSAYEGFNHTNNKLLEMSKIFDVKKYYIIKDVYIPSMRPYIMTGIMSALGISWKVTVAAEVISFPKRAIGSRLFESKLYIETSDVFAWTLVVVLLSFIFEYALKSQFKKRMKKGELHD
jgi:NitT/TauT family transport system permease protein